MTKHIDLSGFHGSETFYRHWLGGARFTEGVKALLDQGEAYWLLDKIVTNQMTKGVKGEEFQVWTLKVATDSTAVLTCCRRSRRTVYSEKITFTDFPEPEAVIWFTNRTALLPSEY